MRLHIWSEMKKDIATYIAQCQKCQQIKEENQHPTDLLQLLPILEWKWEVISINFITGLCMTSRKHYSIMVVVDKLTKEVHFIPIKSTHKASNIVNIFVKDIFILHGLPKPIILDRDVNFT